MSILCWDKHERSNLRHRVAGTIDHKWIRNKLTVENCSHPRSDMWVSLLAETLGLGNAIIRHTVYKIYEFSDMIGLMPTIVRN